MSADALRLMGAQEGVPTVMVQIDCRELTVDEQLALAGALSDDLGGQVVVLVRDSDIVFDVLTGAPPSESEIEAVTMGFISKRKDSEHYSIERQGDRIVVHSADPLARARGRKEGTLPDNLLKCPYCSFVTPHQEAYDVHVHSHAFGLRP